MGFTEFQRYVGSSAVPHAFCLPSLSSLHPPTITVPGTASTGCFALPLASSWVQPKVGVTGSRRRGRRARSWCLFLSRVTSKVSALVRWPCPYTFLYFWVPVTTPFRGFCRPRCGNRTYCYKPWVLHNFMVYLYTVKTFVNCLCKIIRNIYIGLCP